MQEGSNVPSGPSYVWHTYPVLILDDTMLMTWRLVNTVNFNGFKGMTTAVLKPELFDTCKMS